MSDSPRPAPAARVRAVAPYAPPAAASRPRSAVHSPLWLHANEGRAPDAAILDRLRALDAETLRRYAKPTALEAILAAHFGVEPERVVVTAGADDALERLCRAMLEPGRTAVLTDPTFEMLPRYVRLAGGLPVEVPWLDRAFPAEEFERAIDARTRAAFIVSPNNPTGAAVSPADMLGIAGRNPSCLVVADLAYVEFADEDPTAELLRLPNAVVTRTFSKAWGLAGLRVGYAIGPAEAIGWLRTVGHPFPTSGVSLALAAAALEADQAGTSAYLGRVRTERVALAELLRSMGADAPPSQGNFVLARFTDAWAVADALGERGIRVRRFERGTPLGDRLRITCPGNKEEFERLVGALGEILR
ncbi:MAG: histidinol-phosphate aminotransferase family protein [Leptolyngbya sp. PLA2]|nr:histidinol-phosphate aminotransferase family protein [Leptolyngbya sp.]MCE7970990.1 histidinol-phosphate aminotransferase family protein [Leptolyngbya sp. PL-A2]MCZ7631939.1 histidinol-phosphate aminotransferase family protein [Phycisphaerales bacterium]GIK20256.1 MAG: histidinol-phosphate aminotransferase [Planctomycetota bacterium]